MLSGGRADLLSGNSRQIACDCGHFCGHLWQRFSAALAFLLLVVTVSMVQVRQMLVTVRQRFMLVRMPMRRRSYVT